MLAQPGWHDLLTDADHWGNSYQRGDWRVAQSGGEAYSLQAGQLEWDTCFKWRGKIIPKIDEQGDNPRFLVYQPLSGNSNHHFQEHPEFLVDGYWLIQKRGQNYERRPILTHPIGLLLRQFLLIAARSAIPP